MKKDYMIDAISAIDQKYVVEYVQYETKLGILKTRRKQKMRVLLISAACLILTICMLFVSLPLSLMIFDGNPVQEWSNQVVDHLLFPLDQQADVPQDPDAPDDTTPLETHLHINWIEWEMTENVFQAMKAGTEESLISKLKSSDSLLFSEFLQRLGAFLERMYDYFLRHKKQIEGIIGAPEEGTTQNESITESISEEQTTSISDEQLTDSDMQTTEPLPSEYTDEQDVRYLLSADNSYWTVLGRTKQAKDQSKTDREKFALIIPESILDIPVKSIGRYAFFEEEYLVGVTLPNGLNIIEEWAFSYTNLETLVLPESLEVMQEHAFSHIYGLKSVNVMGGVSELPFAAFYHCVNLQDVYLHDGIKKIGNGAFDMCQRLKNIHYPEQLEVIDQSAFSYCYSLANIYIPDTTTTIEYGTFMGAGSYAWNGPMDGEVFDSIILEIPHGVTKIDMLAFAGSALEKVVIPDSVTVIGDAAFSDCHLLNEIEFHGTMDEWNAIEQNSGAYCFGLNWAGDWEASTIRVICTDGELTIDQIPFVHN